MTHDKASEATCQDGSELITLTVRPREKDLGEFTVRRVLPAARQRMVGPFVFFDHMGPAVFPPGKGIQVRPHPHIGLATITYLFEGEIMHRDSLGYEQPILAGAVNLMTAGRGIVHSERAGSDLDMTSHLHGIQSWMALPRELEDIEPAFVHTPAADLPRIEQPGIVVRVIMGEFAGQSSPVTTYSPTLYLHIDMQAGASLQLSKKEDERAFYVVEGRIAVAGQETTAGEMAVLVQGKDITLHAVENSRVMIIGGAALGERILWWNFVASSSERLEQAKQKWLDGGFGKVAGDDEFIPLPQ